MIQTAVRYKLSPRVISNLINCLLMDWKIEDPSQYITVTKVRRLIKKLGQRLQEDHKMIEKLISLSVISITKHIQISKYYKTNSIHKTCYLHHNTDALLV